MPTYQKPAKKSQVPAVTPDKQNSMYVAKLYYKNFKGELGYYVNYSRLEGQKFPTMYADTESKEAAQYEFQSLVNNVLPKLDRCYCITILLNKRFHVRGNNENDVVMCKFLFTSNAMKEDVPTVRFRKDKQAFNNFVENQPYVKWVNWYLKDENGNDSNNINPKYAEDFAKIVKLVKDFWNKTMQPDEVDIWDY